MLTWFYKANVAWCLFYSSLNSFFTKPSNYSAITMSQLKRKIKTNEESAKVQKLKSETSSEIKSPYFSAISDHDVSPDSAAATNSTDSGKRVPLTFYQQNGTDLAKALQGKVLVRRLASGDRVSGMIVETEAYLGREDKAAHSYKGQTEKNKAMFMKPGTAYVYNIYGMYCCMNISSQGEGCAVLIRALQPMENLEHMDKLRSKKRKAGAKKLKPKELCNGPSKLCEALDISKLTINGQDMVTSSEIWLEEGSEVKDTDVITSKRININYAEDWVDKPLRFYLYQNECVSVRDKAAEHKQVAT